MHLKSSGQTPAIQAVMGGKFAQQIICKGVDYASEREEEFYQISVDVRWGSAPGWRGARPAPALGSAARRRRRPGHGAAGGRRSQPPSSCRLRRPALWPHAAGRSSSLRRPPTPPPPPARLPRRGKQSLEKSLASYVQGELMEGENAYYCEQVGKRVSAVRRSCIKELPHTLVIHLKVGRLGAGRLAPGAHPHPAPGPHTSPHKLPTRRPGHLLAASPPSSTARVPSTRVPAAGRQAP
jgi:hypothetical protein